MKYHYVICNFQSLPISECKFCKRLEKQKKQEDRTKKLKNISINK